MKKGFTFLLVFFSLWASAQNKPTEKAQPIVEEGKLLYHSEMASWYGTDLFLANYEDRSNVGGYFSYSEDGVSKCIFYSRTDNPVAIGTISFDSTYNTETAALDFQKKSLYANRKRTIRNAPHRC